MSAVVLESMHARALSDGSIYSWGSPNLGIGLLTTEPEYSTLPTLVVADAWDAAGDVPSRVKKGSQHIAYVLTNGTHFIMAPQHVISLLYASVIRVLPLLL